MRFALLSSTRCAFRSVVVNTRAAYDSAVCTSLAWRSKNSSRQFLAFQSKLLLEGFLCIAYGMPKKSGALRNAHRGLARPDRRKRIPVGQVQARERRLADVGIGVPRQRAKPGFERVRSSGMQVDSSPWITLLDEAKVLVGQTRASSQTVMVAVT